MRNTKPVKLVLEAADEQEEKRRRSIAFAEVSEEQKQMDKQVRDIVHFIFKNII